MTRLAPFVATLSFIAILSLFIPIAASAHEGREVVNGQYELVVGFLDEPAFVGEKNAMIVEVSKPTATVASPTTETEDADAPVEGLADTLKADVIYGDQTMTLEIRPLFNQPGSYVGYFFPMAEGDYSFRIYGDIEGNAVDETFTSGPETFAQVQSREPLEFPKQSASSLTSLSFPAVVGLISLVAGGLIVGRKRLLRTGTPG